jgi:hypothetical protein
MNKDNNASKLPTMLTLRPTTEQQEGAQRQEKEQRMTNDNDDDALIPPTMMMMTMTMMRMSCQSLPFFIGFFIPCQGGVRSDDGGSGDSSFGGSCGG